MFKDCETTDLLAPLKCILLDKLMAGAKGKAEIKKQMISETIK